MQANSKHIVLNALFCPSAGWATNTPATVAASTCWRRATIDTLTSMALAALRCSPLGESVTCSGTHMAATPWPASEGQARSERDEAEEKQRAAGGRRGGETSEDTVTPSENILGVPRCCLGVKDSQGYILHPNGAF